MAEEDHQVLDADFDGLDEGVEHAGGEGEGVDELEAMKQKLKELEEEAAKLRSTQGGAAAEGMDADAEAADGNKEEADARSVFVNNVDYGTTPEELQQLFAGCGTVNRVTILADKFGNPKGFAYVEFMEADAVDNAIMLDNTELRGRPIKVMRKRTNVPGLKRGRGRGRGGRGGYHPRGRGGYYGYAPRGRGRGRYSPY